MPTIGSLCTGVAGLDLAVESHFDADLIWVSDNNDKASEFLSVRYPDVPNIGDLRTADPVALEVPTILTFGFPCQPVSQAGKHKGTDDDRWLFDDICGFIDRLPDRPELLVIENVKNLLSHDQGRTAHRVVSQVAAMGYDLRWGLVRASDAGMPHRRERWFAVAAHTDSLGSGRGESRCLSGKTATGEGQGPQRQRLRPHPRHGGPPPADPDPSGLEGPQPTERHHLLARSSYGPACQRWELISGQPCPPPLDDKDRLNPVFTEWAMGFEPGYVTDVIPTRTHNLRLMGNSVSPPQAALALQLLTS